MYSNKYSNRGSLFLTYFCSETHLEHLPPRNGGGNALSGYTNKKISQKQAQGQEKSINPSTTALLR